MAEIGEYCKSLIEKICSEIGPRPSYSQEANQAAQLIQSEMGKYCKEVEVEEIQGYPAFFKPLIGYPMITTGFYILALVLYFFIPWLAFIIGWLAIYTSLFKMFSLEEYNFFYYIYPKRKGMNIIGKIPPKGEAKHLVILGSHHDSPYYFPLYWKLKKNIVKFVYILFLFAVIFFILIIYQFMGIFIAFLEYLIIIPIIGSGFIAIFGFYFISTYKTLGANDNLSAVSVCLGVAKSLIETPLENTEVWVISFEAEESGMRGSKQFVTRRLEFLTEKLTACINFDIVGVDDIITLPTKESMYRATHTPEVYDKLKEAATNLGIPVVVEKQSFGGTDSAPFSRAHLKAASVLRLSSTGWPSVWHSKDDTPKKIQPNKLAEMVKISLEFLSLIDKDRGV